MRQVFLLGQVPSKKECVYAFSKMLDIFKFCPSKNIWSQYILMLFKANFLFFLSNDSSTSCTSGHHLLQTFPYTLWHHRPGVSRTISRKPVSRRQLRPTLCSMYVTGPESSIVTLLCVTRAVAPKSCGLVSWGPGPSRGLLRQNSAGSSQTWGFNNRT